MHTWQRCRVDPYESFLLLTFCLSILAMSVKRRSMIYRDVCPIEPSKRNQITAQSIRTKNFGANVFRLVEISNMWCFRLIKLWIVFVMNV